MIDDSKTSDKVCGTKHGITEGGSPAPGRGEIGENRRSGGGFGENRRIALVRSDYELYHEMIEEYYELYTMIDENDERREECFRIV